MRAAAVTGAASLALLGGVAACGRSDISSETPPPPVLVSAAAAGGPIGPVDTTYIRQDTTADAPKVTAVALGRTPAASAAPAGAITDSAATAFAPGDSIYVTATVQGVSTSSRLAARITLGDTSAVKEVDRFVPLDGPPVAVTLGLGSPSPWSPGKYTLEVLLDDRTQRVRVFSVR